MVFFLWGIGGAANIVKPPGEGQAREEGKGEKEKEKKSWWKGVVGGSGAGSGEEKRGREGSSR